MSYNNGLDKPSNYFSTKLYTGNGSTNAITGVGFQPDWVWLKYRSSADSHALYDSVRGTQKILQSDRTNAEITQTNGLSSFDSDGFTIGDNSQINTSSGTYVSWNWLAGGSASSNTDGSITSTVSANTTSGFSIVSYTANATAGATVGHGLGAVPKMIIVKSRTSVDSWIVYHAGNTSAPETDYLSLNTTDATVDDAIWNDTAPTSSVFSLGTNAPVNGSGKNLIAYCFAEKKGFSKFGSYTGNGNADGTFVYTGFKPAFFICKRYNDAGYDWLMYDNKRQVSFNVIDDFLKPNLSDAETTGNANQSLDFLSNGVKFRGSGASSNGSGASYIYMCFAENPFVTSGGIPTTAR